MCVASAHKLEVATPKRGPGPLDFLGTWLTSMSPSFIP